MFNNLIFTTTMVDVFLEILGYAKFIKDLLTKKRNMDYEIIDVSIFCSVIISNNMVLKN